MQTLKEGNRRQVCTTFAESAGNSFTWINDTNDDCTITACKPPLTEDHYVVHAHDSAVATVDKDAPPDEYTYNYEFKGTGRYSVTYTGPKIIVGP